MDRQIFENTLLGFLMAGESYGYDLAQHFEEGGDLAAVGRLGRSQLYALLRTLEGKGLAHSALAEGEGGPARRVFRITREGEARFRSWVAKPVASIRGLRVEFVLKAYFFGRLRLPGLEALLDAQRGVLERRLQELETGGKHRSGVGPWVADLQTGLLRAGIQWLGEWRSRVAAALAPATDAHPTPRVRASADAGQGETNRLPARVLHHENAGSVVRVDLEVGPGRVTALVPAETAGPLGLGEEPELVALVPPGGLVLMRPSQVVG